VKTQRGTKIPSRRKQLARRGKRRLVAVGGLGGEKKGTPGTYEDEHR